MERNFLSETKNETSASEHAGVGGTVVDDWVLRLDAAAAGRETRAPKRIENRATYNDSEPIRSSCS